MHGHSPTTPSKAQSHNKQGRTLLPLGVMVFCEAEVEPGLEPVVVGPVLVAGLIRAIAEPGGVGLGDEQRFRVDLLERHGGGGGGDLGGGCSAARRERGRLGGGGGDGGGRQCACAAGQGRCGRPHGLARMVTKGVCGHKLRVGTRRC